MGQALGCTTGEDLPKDNRCEERYTKAHITKVHILEHLTSTAENTPKVAGSDVVSEPNEKLGGVAEITREIKSVELCKFGKDDKAPEDLARSSNPILPAEVELTESSTQSPLPTVTPGASSAEPSDGDVLSIGLNLSGETQTSSAEVITSLKVAHEVPHVRQSIEDCPEHVVLHIKGSVDDCPKHEVLSALDMKTEFKSNLSSTQEPQRSCSEVGGEHNS